jgi:translation initiation factor IF-3
VRLGSWDRRSGGSSVRSRWLRSLFARHGPTVATSTGSSRIAATITTNEPRINDRIRAREVRLVDPDGEQLGIKLLPEALAIAAQLDLDLVEVAPGANPPVCRIMDYGKFKFDAAQRAKESRRKTVHVGIKEMKYRPKIGSGDFETKTRQVAKFLEEGHKVKITIMFRGREVFHPELGKKILDRIAEQMDGMGKPEAVPRLDGRNMVMVLAPDKRAKQSAASKAASAEAPSLNGATASSEAPAGDSGGVNAGEAAEADAPAPAGEGES